MISRTLEPEGNIGSNYLYNLRSLRISTDSMNIIFQSNYHAFTKTQNTI